MNFLIAILIPLFNYFIYIFLIVLFLLVYFLINIIINDNLNVNYILNLHLCVDILHLIKIALALHISHHSSYIEYFDLLFEYTYFNLFKYIEICPNILIIILHLLYHLFNLFILLFQL